MCVSQLHPEVQAEWFARRISDDCLVVNHRLPGIFVVHGLLRGQRVSSFSFTVAAFFPDGWIYKELLYQAAQRFAETYGGRVEHGPYTGAPHTFGVIAPCRAADRHDFGWVGECLYRELLTAVELAVERERR